MRDAKRGLLLTLAAVALVFGLGLSGCLQTSALECMGGTTECNVTCVYLSVDPFNCGGCGNACQPRAICVAPTDGGNLGACECPVGNPLPDGGQTILLCDGACSDITTDPNNCGGCAGAGGTVCSSGQVCAPTDAGSGACETSCGTATECNGACVTLSTDPNNCGDDGGTCASCTPGRTCMQGSYCSCAAAGDCPPGLACVPGTGVCQAACNDALCNGCCDQGFNLGTCHAGTSVTECNTGGHTCQTCTCPSPACVPLASRYVGGAGGNCGCATNADCSSSCGGEHQYACENDFCR